MNPIPHALVIGGTGMLSGVCTALAAEKWHVSVIGRSENKFRPLLKQQPEAIFPIQADYDSEEIFGLVQEAIEARGNFDLIISWTSNHKALEWICKLNASKVPFQLLHIKGSKRYFQDQEIGLPENCAYQKIFLGYMREAGETRWLSHEEISKGIFRQIGSTDTASIIGQIEPYEARPQ
ncbi:short-chain dehydrogenase [Planococcus sp. 1R117A]|uniref:short-chain dehydrogenase n=1 Tax=Planococcus sp. 1R117A TaxID=3447020 RepID=UPI003EDBFECD